MGEQSRLYAAAVGSGIGAWVFISAISGEREAWNSPWYLFVGMPIVCAAAAGLSYAGPRKPRRWGSLPIMVQAVLMFGTQGFGNLWPLRIGFFLVLVVPYIAAAYLGAYLGR